MSIRSSTGSQLERAELYSCDEHGNRIRFDIRSEREIPCNETRAAYQNATLLTEREEQEEIAIREARARAVLDLLTAEEREVLRLHDERTGSREIRREVAVDRLDDAFAAGWDLVKHTKNRAGQVVAGVVVKSFPAKLTYEEIGARMGLSARQVMSRIVSANKKLRGAKR